MTGEELRALLKKQNEETLKDAKEYADTKSTEGITGLDDKLKKLEEKLSKQAEDTLDKFLQARKISLPGLDEELKKKKFGWGKVAEFLLNGQREWPEDSGREKEIIEQTKKRSGDVKLKSANAGTGAAGGVLIPDEATDEVIELAISMMPLFEMGPRVFRGLRGELPIPKVTGRPTAFWVDEEEAPTESETTFGDVTLKPHSLAALSKISRRLIHQSNGLADSIVRDEIAKAIGLKMQQDLLEGIGGDKQPNGLVNTTGLTTSVAIGTNGGRFRVDKAAEMIENIEESDLVTPMSNLGFMMRPRVRGGMKRERVIQFSGQDEANGMPVINPLISQKVLEDILDAKIRVSTYLSNTLSKGSSSSVSNVIYGAWEHMLIGFWEGFELASSMVAGDSTGSAFTQRQVWLLAYQDVDMQLSNAAGFTVVPDAETDTALW